MRIAHTRGLDGIWNRWSRALCCVAAGAMLLALPGTALAEKKYDPGASDTEIKIGNTGPYSGPASTYAIVMKTQAAYFKMLNDKGGINGRKINFISYDDAFSPPKTVEQTRKLVESDEVLLVFATLGTAPAAAIHKYMNSKKVPQLFVGSGASRWNDSENYPWTMGILPSYRSEARAYGTYILTNYPDKKIGILYQNDDFGKDHVAGLKDVLKDKYDKMVIASATFEVTDPTIDSQVVKIQTAKPDIFINLGAPKFTAQAIKRAAELNWRPIQIIANVAVSVSSVLQPAGIDNSKGILSTGFLMPVGDPVWEATPGMKRFREFMAKYMPDADKSEILTLSAYNGAIAMEQVLRQCGDDLTRANIMKQAANLDFEIDTYLPGIRVKTSPKDFDPIEQLQMMRFTGEKWELFGPLIDGRQD